MTKYQEERKGKFPELRKVLDCMEREAAAGPTQGREEINLTLNQILTSLDEFFSPLRELPLEQKRIAIVQREDLYYGFLQRYRFSEEEVPKEDFYVAMEQNVGERETGPREEVQWTRGQDQSQNQQYKIHSIDGTIIIQDPQHNFYIAELKPLPGKGMLLQKRMEQKMSLGDLAAELKLTPAALQFYLKDFIDHW